MDRPSSQLHKNGMMDTHFYDVNIIFRQTSAR